MWQRIDNEITTSAIPHNGGNLEEIVRKKQEDVIKKRNEIVIEELGQAYKEIKKILGNSEALTIENLIDISKIVTWGYEDKINYFEDKLAVVYQKLEN